MAYAPPHDEKLRNPYIMDYDSGPSSSNYATTPTRLSTASLPGYSDGQKYSTDYDLVDSEDPAHPQPGWPDSDHDNVNAAGPQNTNNLGYSDDDFPRNIPSANDAPDAPLFQAGTENVKKARFQDLG